MDDFSILTLTEMDMPPEIEEINIKYKRTNSDEIISELINMLRLRFINILRIMQHN